MATLNEIENLLNIEIGETRLRPGKKKYNKNRYYYYHELYYIVELTQGKYMICSDNRETRQLLRDYCWCYCNGYSMTCIGVGNTTKRYHQLYLNYEEGLVADHINHNKFDNRFENLRVVTHQQNMRNRKKQSNNTSGKQGVFRVTKNNKAYWVVDIVDNNGKVIKKSFNIIKLGNEEAKRRAIQSRRDMEIEFGYIGD